VGSHFRPAKAGLRPGPARARQELLRPLEYELGAVVVLEVSLMDFELQDEAQRVYPDMPLAAVDFPARVIAA
jgi:hypothetical protein